MNRTLKNMLLILVTLVTLVTANGCATGISTYEYEHTKDGAHTRVYVKSANEINQMEMGIDRETGTLDVKIGELDKKSEVATVVQGFERVTGNIAGMFTPLLAGQTINQPPPKKD